MKKCMRVAVGVTLSAALGLGGQAAVAQTNAVANGNWSTGSTWSAGEPTITSTATIGNRTVTIDQAGEVANILDVGTISGQTGNINITGGTLDVGDFNPDGAAPEAVIRLGQAAGSTGNLTMSGGTVFIAEDIAGTEGSGDLVIGGDGIGVATVTGGTLTAGDEIHMGVGAAGNGTLNVSGTGTVATGARDLRVGVGSGHGELNIGPGGTVNVGGWMFSSHEGYGQDGEATTSVINQTGGDLIVGGLFVLGAQGDSTYNHSGGKFTADLFIVSDNFHDVGTNYGTYNISGDAILDTDLVLWVGAWPGSNGTINQTGGTITTGALTVGRDGTGTYNMSGGSWTQTNEDGAAGNNHLIVGQVGRHDDSGQGTGFFNQTGGVVTVTTGLFLGDYDNSEGTYKISGGTLTLTGTGSHPDVNAANFKGFIGDFSVGGALASNAPNDTARLEPTGPGDPQGQALDANGTFIVSGSAATISIAGNFLANPADKSAFRSDDIPGDNNRANSATLGFEIFDNSGTSLIDVGGVADLDGAVIDLDLMSFTPAVNAVFDLLEASSFGSTGTGTTQNVGDGKGFSLASEDVGSWSLAVVAGAGVETLRATFLGVAGVPGDFDNDGDVDGRDFLVWQRGGSPTPLSSGDLTTWQNNYGTGSLAAVSAVPEPSSFVLLGALGLLPCVRRTRRA